MYTYIYIYIYIEAYRHQLQSIYGLTRRSLQHHAPYRLSLFLVNFFYNHLHNDAHLNVTLLVLRTSVPSLSHVTSGIGLPVTLQVSEIVSPTCITVSPDICPSDSKTGAAKIRVNFESVYTLHHQKIATWYSLNAYSFYIFILNK